LRFTNIFHKCLNFRRFSVRGRNESPRRNGSRPAGNISINVSSVIAKKKVILLLWKCWYNNLLISFKLSYQFPLLEAENENCITLIQNQSIFSVSFHYFFFLCHTVVKTQDELAILSGLKNEDKYSFHEKLQNLKEIVGKSKL
jgi:hypothetical protein